MTTPTSPESLRAVTPDHTDLIAGLREAAEGLQYGARDIVLQAADALEATTRPAPPAQPGREERLREALEEAEIVLALVEEPALADPYALIEVRELGDRIGYGNLMNTASEIWRSKLDPSGGEFVAGPCRATVNRCFRMIRAALSTEEPKP